MIDESELLNFIRREIKKQVNVVLAGLSGQNTSTTEDIASQYPGAPLVQARPVMHPYGIVSRAPANTIQVVARVGDHPGNRMVLGHRDAKRPEVQAGEVQLYNQFGQAIYLKNGEIHIGKATSTNPVPVGNEILDFLKQFVAAYKAHAHTGNLGFKTPLNPDDVQAAQELDDNFLENKKILSDYIFVDKEL